MSIAYPYALDETETCNLQWQGLTYGKSEPMETVDVFFCSAELRPDMTVRCREAWQVPMWHLSPAGIGVSKRDFQKYRRVFAERQASGKYYIVADDDCLPPEGDWMSKAVEIMDRYPEFAILSLWPTNAVIQRWTPDDYTPVETEEVSEHFSVGNIRVCRKGAFTDWPEQVTAGYDNTHCVALRKAGWRVGFFRNIKFLHLGEGKTSLRHDE